MRKKLMTILVAGCLCMAVAGCAGAQTEENAVAENDTVISEEAVQETDSAEKETAEEVTETAEEETAEETEAAEEVTGEEETAQTTDAAKTLVVYFSATGNTKAIAEHIAQGVGADLYEIVAQEPYTAADLDYGDDESRSTVEMNDSSSRPAIAGSVENMDTYDTVYIGYPIWWGEAPRILDTFVESYDFTDKTVIPFCTSASSAMGSSASTLESLAGAGSWLTGARFSGNESAEEVMEWVNQAGN